MPVLDPDNRTLMEWLLTALGIGGGGYKIVTHETRLKRLEEDRKVDVAKLDLNITAVAQMKGTVEAVNTTVNEIRDILMGKALK